MVSHVYSCSNELWRTLGSNRPEIVARYTLLLAHSRAITSQLVPPPPLSLTGQDAEKAWNKSLAQSVVVPISNIEQDKEFVVGILLRTKQASS
jgi:hypothetical protein